MSPAAIEDGVPCKAAVLPEQVGADSAHPPNKGVACTASASAYRLRVEVAMS
jgi:hypothetical protein